MSFLFFSRFFVTYYKEATFLTNYHHLRCVSISWQIVPNPIQFQKQLQLSATFLGFPYEFVLVVKERTHIEFEILHTCARTHTHTHMHIVWNQLLLLILPSRNLVTLPRTTTTTSKSKGATSYGGKRARIIYFWIHLTTTHTHTHPHAPHTTGGGLESWGKSNYSKTCQTSDAVIKERHVLSARSVIVQPDTKEQRERDPTLLHKLLYPHTSITTTTLPCTNTITSASTMTTGARLWWREKITTMASKLDSVAQSESYGAWDGRLEESKTRKLSARRRSRERWPMARMDFECKSACIYQCFLGRCERWKNLPMPTHWQWRCVQRMVCKTGLLLL